MVVNGQIEALRPNDDRWPRGRVLFDDTFEDGYGGWTNLLSGTGDAILANAPLSLTGYPSIDGKALKLSTGIKRASVNDAQCFALKRLSRVQESGKLHFEAWFAVGSQDLTTNPAQFGIGIDTQLYDNSLRAFPVLRYRRFNNTTQARINQLTIIGDSGTSDLRDITGGVIDLGENEGKMNLFRMKLVTDLAGVASYVRAELGEKAFDLTDAAVVAQPAGRGAQTPQTASSFAGGLNFYIELINRNTTDNGHAWLAVDRARAWIEG